MAIWRAEGTIKELGPNGYAVIRKASVDGTDWDGLARSMARFELNLSVKSPTYLIDWETLTKIQSTETINSHLLDLVHQIKAEIIAAIPDPESAS